MIYDKFGKIVALLAKLVIIPLMLFGRSFGQCPPASTSTQGRDFWVMFLNASDVATNSPTLIATCDTNAVVTVEIPRANWSTTVNISAGYRFAYVTIPYSLSMTTVTDSVIDAGVHVTSTADISLYSSDGFGHCLDIALVLPTNILRNKYIVQTYPPDVSITPTNSNEIGLLAIEDSTVITISGFGNINLMRGQVYQYSSPLSLSGVEVYSNRKPFALFQGNKLMFIPHGCIPGDNLYEQAIPVNDWGQDFVVVPSAGRVGRGEVVRITSSQDSCNITFDGTVVARNLRRGETFDTVIPYARAKRVLTSKPCYVCQYLTGLNYGDTTGDPSSVTIPPVEQGVCKAIFSDRVINITTQRYVNVVTKTSNVQSMTMDGNSVASYFVVLDNTYSYARIPFTVGEHTLQCASGTFVGHAYGLGVAHSYAHSLGMGSLGHIIQNLIVNGRVVESDTTDICINDTVDVELSTSAIDSSVIWYIDGNRTNINALSFRHRFDSIGYHYIMAITHGMCDTAWCDTLWTVIKVTAPYTDTIRAVICDGDTFNFYGSDYTMSGTYVYYSDTVTHCDTVIVLNLDVLSRPRVQILPKGNYCLEGRATLFVSTNGNDITWTSVPYDTSLTGQEHNVMIYVSPQVPTTYTVTVDSVFRGYSCPATGNIVIRRPTQIEAAMIMSPSKITLDNLQMMFTDITVGDIVRRKWLFNEIPNRGYDKVINDEQRVFYTPHAESDSLRVQLAVVSSEGCTDTTSAVYSILKSALWVPNSFTPDGDLNTLFKVGAYNLEEYEIYIYSRAGLLVFHSTDLEESWDGTYKGKPCSQASYVYVIFYKTKNDYNKKDIKVGSVLLIR